MPKKILLISHTEASLLHHPGGIGEIAHSAKFQRLMTQAGKEVVREDLYSLFPTFSDYVALAELNYALAQQGYSLIELAHPLYNQVYAQVAAHQADVSFLLTWCWGIAALGGCGVHRLCPTITKLYAFHPNEKMFPALYAESDLLLTESLLAIQRGIAYGIPTWKMIYMPHHYPEEAETVVADSHYLDHVACKNKKTLRKGNNTVVIGMASRLESRKNCGFALTAAATLAAKGRDFIFILKGNFSEPPPSLPMEFSLLQKQPWFFWDPDPAPFPHVLREYATFDICLQLSGYEGASNTIVEYLALGKPTLVLNSSTNPFLFKGGALFIDSAGPLVTGAMPYHVPDEKHLLETLDALIVDQSLRKLWSERAKKIARERFHPRIAAERLPLLLSAAKEFHSNRYRLRGEIEALYKRDCEAYGI